MEVDLVFCDTYALIELFGGNQKFAQLRETAFVMTFLNLLEFTYNAINNKGETQAREWFDQLKQNVIEPDDETVFAAMLFRQQNKKLDLSYADALGYVCAKRKHIPFVTGDKAFERMTGVMFIKK